MVDEGDLVIVMLEDQRSIEKNKNGNKSENIRIWDLALRRPFAEGWRYKNLTRYIYSGLAECGRNRGSQR